MMLNRLSNPLVQADFMLLSDNVNLAMQFRVKTQVKLAGERPIWFLIALFAKDQIIINGLMKCLFEFNNGLPLEGDHITRVYHFTMKNISFIVKFDMPYIIFIHQHMMPASFKNRLTETTAPLSVSFLGWGR